MQFGPYTVEISNRDKLFFPEHHITKGEVIEYYHNISDYFLPFVKNRPLTLKRFPDGIQKEGFYQKKCPDYYPEWIKTVNVEKKAGGIVRQIVCQNKATLTYLINQGAISLHPWLSEINDLYKPTRLIFDLDPGDKNFDLVVRGARALRSLLEDKLGLHAFVMTTGSEGMHVVTPITAQNDFGNVHAFAKKIAEYLAREQPDIFTAAIRKDQRKKRLFIDYMRNAYAQTAVSPYSVRAREGAPVATPLEWDELGKHKLNSRSYHIKNIFKRLSKKKDIWNQFSKKAKNLEVSMEKLNTLLH